MCTHVQKQLQIESVALSGNDDKLQLAEAGKEGQGKCAKEEKVCVHELQALFSQVWKRGSPSTSPHLPFMACEL